MYIKKGLYYPAKIFVGIGNYFWGSLAALMLISPFTASTPEKFTDYFSIAGAFFTIWVGHYYLGTLLNKAKFYNTFFENDKDGYLQVRVLAKAAGKEETTTYKDINTLLNIHLLTNCSLQEAAYPVIVLQNPNLKNPVLQNSGLQNPNRQNASQAPQMVKVYCSHCGGENMVRPGFVYQCKYCDGSLE